MSNIAPPDPPNQPISILHVRPSPKPGAVKAYVDIQYYSATVKGLSIVKHNDGHFVGFPSNVGKNGKRFPIVEFSEPERSRIAKLLLEAAKSLL